MNDAAPPAEVARFLTLIATELESTTSALLAPSLRQVAGWVATGPPRPAEGACPGCGADVVQCGVGRPRRWCSARCRNRAAKRRRNGFVVA